LYVSRNIFRAIETRRMVRVEHISHMGEMRNVYKIFIRRPEGKRPPTKPIQRWKDNIRINLGEKGICVMDSCGSG
jgi:hypothetical protein